MTEEKIEFLLSNITLKEMRNHVSFQKLERKVNLFPIIQSPDMQLKFTSRLKHPTNSVLLPSRINPKVNAENGQLSCHTEQLTSTNVTSHLVSPAS